MAEKRKSNDNGMADEHQLKKARQSYEQEHHSIPTYCFDTYTEGQKKFDSKHPQPGAAVIQRASAKALDRVALFTQLSYELEHDGDFMKEFRVIAGEEASSNALALAKQVNSQKGILAALAHQLSNAPHEPDNPRTYPTVSAWLEQYPDHLPALPPILDAEMEVKVFTTASAVTAGGRAHIDSYERLEWLGDGYLEIIVRRIIFNTLTDKDEGEMSTMAQDFVRNDNLARFSLAYGFDERLRTSIKHLAQSFGSTKRLMTKTYGDIFEAYLAAVIESDLVTGYKVAYNWIEALIKPFILKYTSVIPVNPQARSELSRKVLGKGITIEYEEHEPVVPVKGGEIYSYSCFLSGWGYKHQFLGSGKGPSKGQAQTLAAMDALTNPTTAIICAIKREYDACVKLEHQKPKGPNPDALAKLDTKYKKMFIEEDLKPPE